VVLPRLTDAVHSLLAILAPTRTLT